MDVSMMVKIGIVAAALSAVAIMHFIFKAKDDNPVEQAAEAIIKKETGVDIDLTPNNK